LPVGSNAIVFANRVGDQATARKLGGILFIADNGTIYGDVELNQDVTITADQTLTITNGKTFTVPEGITLTNNGTITPANNSTIIIEGTRAGSNKISGANAPQPNAIMRTATSIILSDTTLLATTGQEIEYAISSTTDAPTTGWQTSTVFAGLKADSLYYVYARSKANDDFAAGTPSAAKLLQTMQRTPAISAAPNCPGPVCQAPATYYTLRGVPLGNKKPSAPGVYIEKRGYEVRRVVVR